MVILGGIFQVVGLTLLSTLPLHRKAIPATYGYEVILGIGLGLNIAALMVLPPYVVEKRDQGIYHYPLFILNLTRETSQLLRWVP